MKIGLYIKWPKNSLNNSDGNVLGDELHGESLCKALRKIREVTTAELYAPNYLPQINELDVMIYLNDTEPNNQWAKKHLLYLQNAYGEGSELVLKKMCKNKYDKYAFISQRLLNIHKKEGHEGIFLPFGVDTEMFYPRPFEEQYNFDVAYIGNDIKGEFRTNKFLLPAIKYNFGLFGNWKIPRHRFRIWKNFGKKHPAYLKKFNKISKGKIAQEKVPVLYNSAKINLNCTAQDCVDWDVITLRTYEVLACKGFLITDIVPVAKQLMPDCMIFTTGGVDLTEKIEHFLKNKEERNVIAQNGYNYVMKNCSIDSRAKELFQYIKE